MAENESRHPHHAHVASATIIAVAFALALAIRIGWPFDSIFVDGNVWFRGMDAWYHMRLVDNFLANFPHTTAYDPFTWYPRGLEPPFHPLTGWLVGGLAFVMGGASPSAHTVDVAGALFPAMLGALIVVPTYFIGRRLFGSIAGAVGALLLAIAPGELLSRSLLGFADHHVSEAFFSAMTLMCVMYATQRASSADVRLAGLRSALSGSARSTILWTVCAGVALGLYLLAWRGGLMVLLILFVYVVIRGILDYANGRHGEDVVIVVTGAVVIGGIMSAHLAAGHWTPELFILALLACALVPTVMWLLARFARQRGMSARGYIAFLFGCGGVLLVLGAFAFPTAFRGALHAIDFMVVTGRSFSILEMHPLFFPQGEFSLRVAWTNFTAMLPVSILGLFLLWRSSRSPRGNHVVLFAVWSLIMLAAVLSQRRFGYYYMLNACVLSGFLVAWVFKSEWCARKLGIAFAHVPPAHPRNKAARRAMQSMRAERRGALASLAIVLVAIVGVLAVPSMDMARNFAVEPSLMTQGWWETLQWLRDSTPEPMDEDAYYSLYDHPGRDVPFDYPDSAYSIMAWWDYGHWLTRVSHRIPISNPFQQGARTAADFFLADSPSDGTAKLEELDSRYIVLDVRTSVATFHGVAGWADAERDDYFKVYSQRGTGGELETIVLYYPEYYRTMLVRLFNFSGQAFAPDSYQVIRYADSGGLKEAPRLITGLDTFDTYDAAVEFVKAADDEHVRLVSGDPLVSCVALESLEDYTLVFDSPSRTTLGGHPVPEVKVFEFDLE